MDRELTHKYHDKLRDSGLKAAVFSIEFRRQLPCGQNQLSVPPYVQLVFIDLRTRNHPHVQIEKKVSISDLLCTDITRQQAFATFRFQIAPLYNLQEEIVIASVCDNRCVAGSPKRLKSVKLLEDLPDAGKA